MSTNPAGDSWGGREGGGPHNRGARPRRALATFFRGLLLVGLLVLAAHLPAGSSAAEVSTASIPATERGALWVTPLSLDFGPVGVGATSAPQVVTITNVGSGSVTSFAGGAPWDTQFKAGQNCAGGLAPGASCQYTFRFAPTAAGTFTTTSNSSTNVGPFTIELRGTGVGAGLFVTPLELDFGSVMSGTTSAPQTVTIINTGLSTLTNFAGGGVYPPFSASQNCASGVAPGASCQYFFRFAPTAAGRYAAVSGSATNAGAFSIHLQGGESTQVSLPVIVR